MPRRAKNAILPGLVLLLCAVAALQARVRTERASTMRGDVNGDGQITALDALAVLSSTVGRTLPAGFTIMPNGDADGNGTISALDALIIQSHVVGRDVSQFPVGKPIVRVTVAVSPAAATITVGGIQQLTGTVAGSANTAVAWRSASPGVATVSPNGLVTAVAVGQTTITAIAQADTTQKASASITVAQAPPAAVASISLSPSAATLQVGGTQQITATLRDAAGNVLNGRAITWTSSDLAKATVSATGVVTGIAAGGPVTITAGSEGKSGTATVTVAAVSVQQPAVTTLVASSVGATGATLNGTVDGTGATTQAWFEWGASSDLNTSSSTPFQSPGSGSGDQTVAATLSGLNPNSTYYYRIAASNSGGTTRGSILSFNTLKAASISLSPENVSFSATPGGASPASQTVSITNGGNGTLNSLSTSITYSNGQPTGWLNASLSGTTAPATLTLNATVGSLTAATYTATVQVSSGSATNSPRSVGVSFTVAQPPACTNSAELARKSHPDGAQVTAGQSFTMEWAVRNTGTCTWSSGYALRYVSKSNEQLSLSQANVALSGTVAPGATYTFPVPMRAPDASGTHREDWGVFDEQGRKFQDASVQIQVPSPPANPPVISSVSPPSPIQSGTDQTLTVSGSNFQSGLTVTATFPNGQSATLSGEQIRNVTATSFQLVIRLGDPGSWNIRVNNPDGKQSSPYSFTVQQPVGVSVSPAAAAVTVGGTQQVTAAVTGTTNTAVVWRSASPGVATVSSSGLVTAAAVGQTTVTAVAQADTMQKASASITVTQAPVASVSLSPTTATLQVGGTQQFTATPRDASGNALTGRTVSWSSSNTAVATVSAAGLVTGVASGTATITATSEGKSGTATVTVNAPTPTEPRVALYRCLVSGKHLVLVGADCLGGAQEGRYGYAAATQAAGTVPLYAARHGTTGHFLATTSAPEHSGLVNSGWHDYGLLGYVWQTAGDGRVGIHRLFSSSQDDHLYSSLEGEGGYQTEARNYFYLASAPSSVSFSAPQLSGVSPNPVQGSTSNTVVVLTGQNFQSGATATVWGPTIPNGVQLAAGSQVFVESLTKAIIKIVTMSSDGQGCGTWRVRINTPDGKVSNEVSFTAAGCVAGRLRFDYPVGTADGTGWLNNPNGLKWLEQYNYGGSCGWVYHPGVDMNKDGTSGDGDLGEPVYAVADGKVIASGHHSGWGNVILVEHSLEDGSKVWSQYGHLQNRSVSAGNSVSRRQQIGTVGKGDGGRFSAHLHFEIRKASLSASAFPCSESRSYVEARYYDPLAFIASHRN